VRAAILNDQHHFVASTSPIRRPVGAAGVRGRALDTGAFVSRLVGLDEVGGAFQTLLSANTKRKILGTP